MRIAPLAPFRFLDISAGLTRISFREYFLVSAVGSPVRIFWLQFILAAVGVGIFQDINSVMGYFLANKTVFVFSLIYLIAAIVAALIIKKSVLKGGK